MEINQTRRAASKMLVLAILAVICVGFLFAAPMLGINIFGGGKTSGPRIIEHTVQRGDFVLDAVERGEVESFDNVEIKCRVKSTKGQEFKILEVVDEGSRVKTDQIVVQLDSAALELELTSQRIVCNTKEATLITSKNAYLAAEISLEEYEKGTFEQEEQTAQSTIFIAEENLRKAKEYAAYSERLSARGYVTQQQLEGDRFAVEKARTELAAAKTTLRVLQEFTKPKQMLTLEADIKSAKAAWEADQNSYDLELDKLENLTQEIEKCTIKAPQDGQVIYANRQSSRSGAEFIVEPGSGVRENQVILRMPSSDAMQVKAKVNETRVNSVHPGLPATIRVDAFGDRTIRGEVTKVNEYPEPTSWYQAQTKEYATEIRILENIDGIRPGLTAEVTIHIESMPDAILIPMQCIHEIGKKTWCFRNNGTADNPDWEAVEIDVTANNDKYVTLENGINDGDVLAMNPRDLVSRFDLGGDQGPETSREALGGGGESGGRPKGAGAGGGRPKGAGAGGGRPKGAGGAGGGRPAGAGAGGGKPKSAGGGGRPAGAGGGGKPGGGKPAGAGKGRPGGGS